MKNILYSLMALLLFSFNSFAQIMNFTEYAVMTGTYSEYVNNVLSKECPQGTSLDQFKANIVMGYSQLSPTAQSNLIAHAAPLLDYGNQFASVNDIIVDNDAQRYFLSSFTPNTIIQNGKLVENGLTVADMWSCAFDSFKSAIPNCNTIMYISDKSDVKSIAKITTIFLTKQAGVSGMLIMLDGFRKCINREVYSFQNTSGLFSDIQPYHIDTNDGTLCTNNILIFPSWQRYNEIIDILDNLIDTDYYKFDATVASNISDDQYDYLASLVNYDEDNTLKDFEDNFAFCSLRTKIAAEEITWLDQQGDGEWDMNTDPDNHFIDDETERALLSTRAEVIIKDDRGDNVYYKFLDDLGSWIEVHNNDTTAISQVSNGNTPTDNPNVIPHYEREQTNGDCKFGVVDRKIEKLDETGNRFKRISIVKPAWGKDCSESPCSSALPSKIKAKTKGYKKNANGKWRAGRTTIAAGICGEQMGTDGYLYVDCTEEITVHEFKEKRKRRVKVKKKSTTEIPAAGNPQTSDFGVKNNKVYSYHKQGALMIIKDFYDLP